MVPATRGATRSGVRLGLVLLFTMGAVGEAQLLPHEQVASASTAQKELPLELTVTSPRPFFMQASGQGPQVSANRVVWTATNGQGQTGSEADRIYAYDLIKERLSTPVRSHFGDVGYIGGYVLVGNTLAYIDSAFAPGGIFTWRLELMNMHSGTTTTIATSPQRTAATNPPAIDFDGNHLLMLDSVSQSLSNQTSEAQLYTLSTHRWQTLEQNNHVLMSDPTLSGGTALWTEQSYGDRPASQLIACDLKTLHRHLIPVGDVSQVSAGGDYVVWKSGMNGMNGTIVLYSLSRNRILSPDLAHSKTVSYPSTNGKFVAWTCGDGSCVQVYSIGSNKVIYSAYANSQRRFGLTGVDGHAVSWAYTTFSSDHRNANGYIVVRQIR